jgi:tetratricopeptide (TPR) repeat protein
MIKKRTNLIFFLLIITVGFTVYSNSLNNEFVWDDRLLIVDNQAIQDLRNIPTLFTKNIAFGTSNDSNYYRPLQTLSYALNFAIWKLDRRAYHLTNIVIHILAAMLLFYLVQLLFSNQAVSLLSALLFISHPIHTSAVAYISGRADPLVALFILCSVIFYIRYAQKEKRVFYFFSLSAYLCALLSKEIGLVVPLLLLAYDCLYKNPKRTALKKHLPFFSLGLIYIILRKTVLNFPATKSFVEEASFFQRIPLIFKSLYMYFGKLLIPLNLHMEHQSVLPPFGELQVILGLVIASMLVLLAIIYRKKQALISFAVFWFLINYLPVSNIYPLQVAFAEHWIYTPSLGLFILAAWSITKLCDSGRVIRWFVCAALGFLVTGNLYLTRMQNQYWRTPETFYQRTLFYAPHSAKIYFRLALLDLRKGRADRAIENLERAIEISPNSVISYENLVASYIEKGRPDKAIDICESALKIEPDSDILHNNLGVAYLAKGLNDKALSAFKKALSLNPKNATAHNNLGRTYANIGKKKKALAAFKKAIAIEPNLAIAHNNLARTYYEARHYDLAIQHCDRAVELGFRVPRQFQDKLLPFRQK